MAKVENNNKPDKKKGGLLWNDDHCWWECKMVQPFQEVWQFPVPSLYVLVFYSCYNKLPQT